MTPTAGQPDPSTYEQFAARLQSLRNPVLLSHVNPDGDALGSLVATRECLRRGGAQPWAVVYDEVPLRLARFNGDESLSILGKDLATEALSRFDGVVLLDTCAFSQLTPVAEWLRTTPLPKLVIDHHASRDDLATETLIDESAAATCLLLHELFESVRWEVSPSAGEALFVGIATDTGWFRHGNTDLRVLKTAASLVSRGVQPWRLHQDLYQHESPGRIRLLGEALSSLQLHAGDRLALMVIPADSFARFGAVPSDTEDIVNEPLRIERVLVSVLLVQQPTGPVRINLRSKPPLGRNDPDVDVAALAKRFGGGGHHHAAGARMNAPLTEVRQSILMHLVPMIEVLSGSGTGLK